MVSKQGSHWCLKRTRCDARSFAAAEESTFGDVLDAASTDFILTRDVASTSVARLLRTIFFDGNESRYFTSIFFSPKSCVIVDSSNCRNAAVVRKRTTAVYFFTFITQRMQPHIYRRRLQSIIQMCVTGAEVGQGRPQSKTAAAASRLSFCKILTF